MDIDELAVGLGHVLFENGAKNVEVWQVEEKNKLTKRIVIGTLKNNQEAKKLAYYIKDNMGEKCLHTDGIFRGDWVVLDIGDVIVHIFTKETRQKFNLEKLYKDAKNCFAIQGRV